LGAVQAIVRLTTGILDTVKDQKKQIELINVLRGVTEGKLFVEIDRARLTRRLAEIHESNGDVGTAADVIQEIAVETFGAMHRSEKIAFVLEQMRLCMDAQDFTRAQILSRKVWPDCLPSLFLATPSLHVRHPDPPS
jgi:26S proteasome regulatory subunit N5